jgi:diaminopimelate epimerase
MVSTMVEKIIVHQDQVGRFAADFAAVLTHRDADIRILERGASFTPSPVMATIASLSRKAFTMRIYARGSHG